VTVLQIEFDRTNASSRSAAELRDTELETIGQVDADPMFGACHGVVNGFARRLKKARYFEMRPTRLNIDLKRDRLEQRLAFGRTHCADDPPDRGHLLCLLTRQDLQERVALRGVGPFVDDQLHGAVALVDRSGKYRQQHRPQAVEPNIAKIPFFDLNTGQGPAITVGRQSVELTRASVGAIAVVELRAFDDPFCRCHDLPPVLDSLSPGSVDVDYLVCGHRLGH
jgi:hypothetical protein